MIIFTLLFIALCIIIYAFYSNTSTITDHISQDIISEEEIIPTEVIDTSSESNEEDKDIIAQNNILYNVVYLLYNIVIYTLYIILFKIILNLLWRFYGLYLAQQIHTFNDDNYLWIITQVLFYESNAFNRFTKHLFIILLSFSKYFKGTDSLYSKINNNIKTISQLEDITTMKNNIYFRFNPFLYIHVFYNLCLFTINHTTKKLSNYVLPEHIFKESMEVDYISKLNISFEYIEAYIEKDGFAKEEYKTKNPSCVFKVEEKTRLKEHFEPSQNLWQKTKKIIYQEFIEPILNLHYYWKYGFFFQNRKQDAYISLLTYLYDKTQQNDDKINFLFNDQNIINMSSHSQKSFIGVDDNKGNFIAEIKKVIFQHLSVDNRRSFVINLSQEDRTFLIDSL